jgi:hypothetical protein
MPPFSFFIDFPGSDPTGILGEMLISGARRKYGRQLSHLSDSEIGTLREYLLSIGWDADYHLVSLYKEAVDYHPDGEPYVRQVKINNWQITFKPADQSLRPGAQSALGGTRSL